MVRSNVGYESNPDHTCPNGKLEAHFPTFHPYEMNHTYIFPTDNVISKLWFVECRTLDSSYTTWSV